MRKYTVAMTINFIGLSLAFTAFLILTVQAGYELGFDRSHPTSGRIYRVDKAVDKDDVFRNILPRGYADDIIRCSPHIQAGTVTCPFLGEMMFNVEKGDGHLPEVFKSKVNVVYPEMFEVFGVDFVEGGAEVLEDLTSAAIPQSLAKKLCGNESAIGTALSHKDEYRLGAGRDNGLVVRAVYKDFPENSQMSNDIYVNIGKLMEGSYGGANFNCYLLLDSSENKALVEQEFNDNMDYDDTDWLTAIELTPIEDIYFEDAGSAIYRTGNRRQMWMLICISIIVLLVGGINYTTFFTALSPMRAKSINTRKILGSGVSALRAGLIMESVLFSCAAFAMALCIVVPVSSALASEGVVDMPFRFAQQIPLTAVSAVIAVLTGIMAGLFPSIYVTSMPPAYALKGDIQYSLSGKHFRSLMMIVQYAVAFVLIVFVISLYRQNKYMMNSETGFEKDKIAVVEISQKHYKEKSEWLRQSLTSLAEVEDVSFAMECVGGSDMYSTSTFTSEGNEIRTFVIYCCPDFLEVMGIPVVEGRGFTESDKSKGCVIMNKAAADRGAVIGMGTGFGEIIGMTGEVRINSLRNDISPVCYQVLPDGYASFNYAYIRLLDGVDRLQAVEKINGVLREMDPEYLFETRLYDSIMGELYKPEIKQEKVISLFSVLAAVLALAGIFGQVLLDLQYSRRSIAIKKVYGADTWPLVAGGLLKYSLMVIVSFIVAAPLGWMSVVRWQRRFVERVGISGMEFIAAFACIEVLTIAIVAFMYWRASRSNPADTLSKE